MQWRDCNEHRHRCASVHVCESVYEAGHMHTHAPRHMRMPTSPVYPLALPMQTSVHACTSMCILPVLHTHARACARTCARTRTHMHMHTKCNHAKSAHDLNTLLPKQKTGRTFSQRRGTICKLAKARKRRGADLQIRHSSLQLGRPVHQVAAAVYKALVVQAHKCLSNSLCNITSQSACLGMDSHSLVRCSRKLVETLFQPLLLLLQICARWMSPMHASLNTSLQIIVATLPAIRDRPMIELVDACMITADKRKSASLVLRNAHLPVTAAMQPECARIRSDRSMKAGNACILRDQL